MVVNAQNDEKTIVTYDIQYNTELPNVKQGILEVSGNKKESVFRIISNNTKHEKCRLKNSPFYNAIEANIFFSYNLRRVPATFKRCVLIAISFMLSCRWLHD